MTKSARLRHLGVHVSQGHLLKITATLRHGAVLPVWWPAPLDGLLSTAARRRRLGHLYGDIVDHHIEDIPLVMMNNKRVFGSAWIWAATAAQHDSEIEDVRWIHKRFDSAAAELVVDRLPANTDVGVTKSWRLPRVATITPTLQWWAAGDADKVTDLLDDVVQIGKSRAAGEGVVVSWDVEDCGPSGNPLECLQLIATKHGHPARPFPKRSSHLLGFGSEPDVVMHAARPPYWRGRQTVDGNGLFSRAHPEVIAPWMMQNFVTPSAV